MSIIIFQKLKYNRPAIKTGNKINAFDHYTSKMYKKIKNKYIDQYNIYLRNTNNVTMLQKVALNRVSMASFIIFNVQY